MSDVFREQPDGITLVVHAQPGAQRSAFVGMRGAELIVKVGAPPVSGAANKELRAFLAKFFHVPKSAVTVIRGQTARHKAVLIQGDPKRLAVYIQDVLANEQD